MRFTRHSSCCTPVPVAASIERGVVVIPPHFVLARSRSNPSVQSTTQHKGGAGVLVLAGNVETQAGERDDDHGWKEPLSADSAQARQDPRCHQGWGRARRESHAAVGSGLADGAAVCRAGGVQQSGGAGPGNWACVGAGPGATPSRWGSSDCLTKTVGGRRGWRLPSIPELTA
jgi:hypothetical protein